MESYQMQKVIDEKKELDIKIVTLTGFIHSDKIHTVNKEQQELLEYQMHVMMEYSKMLKKRIAAFQPKGGGN